MKKFNKPQLLRGKSVNKSMFQTLPIAMIIQPVLPVCEDVKTEEIKLEIKQEDQLPEIPEIQEIPETQEVVETKEESEDNTNEMYLSFDKIYEHNVEVITDKDQIQLTKYPSMRLAVEQIMLNLKKQKINGWKVN